MWSGTKLRTDFNFMIPADYISDSAAPYVFTNNTGQLPIRTQLVEDRSGEPIENFMICLPDLQTLQSMGAQAVQPTCVTITIVDDDCKIVCHFDSLYLLTLIKPLYYYHEESYLLF